MSFLEGRAESGLVGAELVLTAFREKGRKAETRIHRPLILLFSVLSFSSPYSKDQHKEIWINAEFFLGDRSTIPDTLNTDWFLHCSAPDLCEFFKPAVTFWCHVNQIHCISELSHRDKRVHGSNKHTITSHRFSWFSCSWLFLRGDIGKKGVKGLWCFAQLALSVAELEMKEQDNELQVFCNSGFFQRRFGTVCELAPEADANSGRGYIKVAMLKILNGCGHFCHCCIPQTHTGPISPLFLLFPHFCHHIQHVQGLPKACLV